MTNILALPQLPQQDPFVIVTNADFRDGLQFLQDASANPAVPLNIGGIAFRASIRSADDSASELISASTAQGTIKLDPEQGVMAFAVPALVLQNLEAGEAIGDIVAEAPGYVINLCKDNGPLKFTIRRGLS